MVTFTTPYFTSIFMIFYITQILRIMCLLVANCWAWTTQSEKMTGLKWLITYIYLKLEYDKFWISCVSVCYEVTTSILKKSKYVEPFPCNITTHRACITKKTLPKTAKQWTTWEFSRLKCERDDDHFTMKKTICNVHFFIYADNHHFHVKVVGQYILVLQFFGVASSHILSILEETME